MTVRQDRTRERGKGNKSIERALDVWQPRSSRKLTSEDIRQITENTTGFFRILLEWEANERALRESKSENLS
jgi:hypothetical protein